MFKRHNLVWLNDGGWQSARFDDAQRQVVQHWQAQQWPLIVRRRDVDATNDEICLGIAAPPDSQGCKRVAVRTKESGIHSIREPLEMGEVTPHAPAIWRERLARLQRDAKEEGITLRVYGSLALQTLTGQRYWRETSDIDVLLVPRDRQELRRMLELLERHRHALPLDGELEFPDGSAVSWKEWMRAGKAPGNRVLVKRATDVALLRIDQLLSALGEYTCSA